MSVIGTLAVNIVAKTSDFVGGLSASRKELAAFKKTADVVGTSWSTSTKLIGAGLAALTTGAVISSIRSTAEELDNLGKVADKLGLKSEAMAALRFGGAQAGVDAGILDVSLQKLINNISEVAKAGKGAAAPALAELGLRAEELVKKSPDKMLEATADAMKGVTNNADKVRLSIDLFGKSGTAMLAMLADGSAGLRAMQDEAKALGIAIDRESIAKVEEMNDAMGRLSAAMGGFKTRFIIDIAPAATKAVNALTETMAGLGLMANGKPGWMESTWGFTKDTYNKFYNKPLENFLSARSVRAGVAAGTAAPDLLPTLGSRGVVPMMARQPFDSAKANEFDRMRANVNANMAAENERQLRDQGAKALWGAIDAAALAVKDKTIKGADWLGEQRKALDELGKKSFLANIFKPSPDATSVVDLKTKEEQRKLAGRAMAQTGNDTLLRGTAAAFVAERAGDRMNSLMREQVMLAKQQVASLQKIATNTAKGADSVDVWEIG